jgi:small conductance mechanosensitive channel
MTPDQVQQIGQTTAEVSVSLFQTLYSNPFVHGIISLLYAFVLSLMLILISKIIATFIRNRIVRTFWSKDDIAHKKMGILVWDLLFYLMSFLSIYVAFTIAGIDIKLLMSWITIWVGFAFRQTLSNMISWIIIYSTAEYKVWNIVQLSFEWNVFWIIEEINMKNVTIRTFDMRRVIIPNSKFLGKAIKTYSAEEFLRIESEVVVDVNLDISHVIDETLTVVNAFPFILNKEYTQVLLESFDDKKAKLSVQMFFNPNSWYSSEYIKSLVQIKLLDLYKKLDKDAKSLKVSPPEHKHLLEQQKSDIQPVIEMVNK